MKENKNNEISTVKRPVKHQLTKDQLSTLLAELAINIPSKVLEKKYNLTKGRISQIKNTKLVEINKAKQDIASLALDNANYALTEARKKNLSGDSYHSLVSAAREAAYTSRMILGEEDKQAEKIPITIQIGQSVTVNKSPDKIISVDKEISNNEDNGKAT